MCGISGILALEGRQRIDRELLRRMTGELVHRGPDGEGFWLSPDGTVGLGHRRLSIIDLSERGSQPMSNEDGTVWVTFNGEIYNYLELRRELEARGHAFRSQTDTEVLVHLYEEHGPALVDRLDGEFAFAIWDETKKELLLARDAVGVHPLYYTRTATKLLFASEIKAILRDPEIKREVNDEGLYHYLTFLVVPAPQTMFKDIHKVQAGETILVSRSGQMGHRRYWQPLPEVPVNGQKSLDEELESLLVRAVKKRLMSDVPLGVLFSGGVDSSLNAASCRVIDPAIHPHTFHVGLRAANFPDDRPFASSMAQCIGTKHSSLQIDDEEFWQAIVSERGVPYYQDEPYADPVSVPLFFICKLARDSGIKVLHSGEGADELFGGYVLQESNYRRERAYWRPLRMLPPGAARIASSIASRLPGTRALKIADSARRAALGQEFFLSQAVAFYEMEKQSILSREFRASHAGLDSFDVVRPLYERLREQCPQADYLQIMLAIELQLRLPELLLTHRDKMAMANSIELRVPFLDRDVVRFALRLSKTWKWRNGVLKEPLKRLATSFVDRVRDRPIPDSLGRSTKDLFYRPKLGFGAPLEEWLRSRLGAQLRSLLQSDREILERYFNLQHIERELDEGPKSTNRAFQLWTVANFALWRRAFNVQPS